MTTAEVRELPYCAPDPSMRGRQAEQADYHTFVDKSTVIVDAATKKVALVYLASIPDCTDVLLDVLQNARIPMTDRMGGMKSRARIFGYRPMNMLRNPFCDAAEWEYETRDEHAEVTAVATLVTRYYKESAPLTYAEHMRQVNDVHAVRPEWRIGDTPFTSGIVNLNGQLPYHTDSNNIGAVWSGMLAFKHNVKGGYLSIPGYGLALEIADKSLSLFDAQATLHGVTPMQVGPDGYRYTLVVYSREHMGDCMPRAEEVPLKAAHRAKRHAKRR